jgi:XTP/dITP diphosphohydrolase
MHKLLLATHNADKAREFRVLLEELQIEILTLDRFPDVGPVVEDGETLEENAAKKAREVFLKTGLPSIADDTGLEVRYLNDRPGVYSSRFAGEGASYADNCAKLLREMRGVPPRRRGARFRCVLAFAAPEGVLEFAEGVCRGVITETPRGINGFGYDPVFLPLGETLTFGELEAAAKNRLSHRGRAIRNIKPLLRDYFRSP